MNTRFFVIAGIVLVLPAGSPGMGGENTKPLSVYSFTDGHVLEKFMSL